MPNPARNMGVNPSLGLTTEPVKVLIGECYIVVVRQGGKVARKREIGGSNSYTLYTDLFEIAAGLVSDHDAEFMDTL
jgi:hypothetical protein